MLGANMIFDGRGEHAPSVWPMVTFSAPQEAILRQILAWIPLASQEQVMSVPYLTCKAKED